MFDQAPPNLPVEPVKDAQPPRTPSPSSPPPRPPTVPPAPPPAPSGPPQKSAPVQTSVGQKEPEDIFADIKEPAFAEDQKPTAPSSAPTAPAKRFPWVTVLLSIVIVVGLGIGGYFAYNLFFADSDTTPSFLRMDDGLEPTIPIVSEPGDAQPIPNPIPEPDPDQLAAAQASAALLRAQAEAQGQMPPSEVDAVFPSPDTATSGSDASVVEPPPNIPPPVIDDPEPSSAMIVMGEDSDSDGLTDAEEFLFSTDPFLTDSDGDGYDDGSEVMSGYDPAMAMQELEDSSWLKVAPIGNVAFLIPSVWNTEEVPGGMRVRSGSSAAFSVTMEPYEGEDFNDWLALRDPNAALLAEPLPNASGLDVLYFIDGMTAWLVGGDTVYTIRYELGTDRTKEFLFLFDVFLRRARLL